MMKKKGFELSMNVIIVAAIALIVLVVVILIFTGKVKSVNKDLDSCTSKGGMCEPNHGGLQPCGPDKAPVTATCPDNQVCCISLL
ncbi:hypothetical protein D6764_05830 [Candidatus Woesearchaeota archaeon]|nr:MAG: hypothetical protein D6764_05830 [Candidatus Woesearchaeota archaeon]